MQSLKQSGARIDVWGVGTRLVTAYDQPALGGVYKLSALQDEQGEWQPKLKLSEQPIKVSTPGMLQTRRYLQEDQPVADVIYDQLTGLESPCRYVTHGRQSGSVGPGVEYRDLLVPVFRRGDLVYQQPSIQRDAGAGDPTVGRCSTDRSARRWPDGNTRSDWSIGLRTND